LTNIPYRRVYRGDIIIADVGFPVFSVPAVRFQLEKGLPL
jgi:hypothetical protein